MNARAAKFRNSPLAAILLHLLLPGLGHLYWREYLFGIFIFLVMLMAGALFVLGLFIHLPGVAKLVIYGLPVLFYLISFGDLYRTVRRKLPGHPRTPARMRWCFGIAVLFQLFWPLAPLNFAWQNAPSVFVLDSNQLAPLYQKGDLMKASRLAYTFHTYLVAKPIFHSLPDRFDVVRFFDKQSPLCGVVIGLPGEEIELVDGVLTVDNVPQLHSAPGTRLIDGDWPPTATGDYTLLVAASELGRVTRVYEVSITDLIGKVERIL